MAIDPEQVLKQIGTLWTDLAQGSERADQVLMRACALTLVVLVDAEETVGVDVSTTLAALMHTHPSRAIVVRVAKGDAETLEASVRAQCRLPPSGGKQICSEEITIDCSGRTLSDAVSVVDVLGAPDLPAVLWCRSERAFRNPAFASFVAAIPRVITETARFSDPLEGIRDLAVRANGASSFTDLSWTQITRWRELVAQSFENVVCGAPGDITGLTVRYQGAGEGPAPASVFLFAGWVAHCLRWRLEDAVASRNGATDVSINGTQVRLEKTGSGGAGSHIAEVELTSVTSPVRLLLRRVDSQSLSVQLDLEGCPPMEHRVSFPASDDVSVLNEELRLSSRDTVFESSLRAAALLAEIAA